MNATLSYETRPCGRCGGGGRYSYCTMYGDTCFKCGGVGKVKTAAGAKAAAAVKAFIAEHFSVPVSSLTPGMHFMDTPVFLGQKLVVCEVISAGVSTSTWKSGTMTEALPFFNVHFKAVKSGKEGSHGFCHPTDTVQLPLYAERWAQVVAFAKTLKKGVTVVEAAPAASVSA